MSLSSKSIKTANGGKASDNSDGPSNNLWVGNLSTDVTDSDLMSLFSKYGAVDSITAYASRSYAFVYFKRVEHAKAALEALHGTYLRGNSMKIEFAKPAKPCKSLWVSGISPSVTKEVLEKEFLKFGKIEEFKFIRERNTAYIDYFRLEDASQALKSMNGKRIGGDHIRVDFLRSHTSRREHVTDYRDSREGQKVHSESSGGQKGDGQPSNILWIGYPPSVHMDEQMLHNAMILFGEIERIRSFPSKHYSFVEFRSVDEARRAKEGLQGRLFNDPRISIMYSSSGPTRSNDYPVFYPGVKGPRPDVLFDEPPFQPAHIDMFNHNRPLVPNALSRPAPSGGVLGPNRLMRPFGPQGSFETLLSGPEFNDLSALNKRLDANPNSLIGGPNWRRSSPAPGIFPSPSQVAKRPVSSGAWDVFDANQLQRESKRSRMDTVLPAYDSAFPLKKMDDHGSGLDQLYGLGPQVDGSPSGPFNNVQEKNLYGPVETRMTTRGMGQGYPDHDYIWRGVIAKGGTPVCRARCVPVGEGIEFEIPEVVNCSARTGLDMLTKHYADAVGFSVIFFLPDSEEDFASYTEFLRYLGAKDRAGVAKFDDGTTLFLVPPSDFLYKVLKVEGPERLYGVVLKFPQHAPSNTYVQPQSIQSQYIDGQQMPSHEYSGMHQEEKALQMDYSRLLREDSLPPSKQLAPPTTDSISMQPAPSVNTAAMSQAGIALTPELIATLASLLPASSKSSGAETAQPSVGTSTMRPPLPPTTELHREVLQRDWTHDRSHPEQTAHPVHQVENQYNPHQHQLSQLQTYPTALSTSSDYAMGVTVHSQVQDPAFQLPQQGASSSRPLSNFGIPSQSGQMEIPHQVNRQHQYEVPQNTQKGFGIAHGTDSLGSHGSSFYQHSGNSVTFSNQVHGSDVTQPLTAMPLAADKGYSEVPNQGQQLQSTVYGANQGTSEVEVDKNQRYQSTLQFAANLLLQIQQQQQQQQQQQTSTHGGQDSDNH
ncbi:flowering time control protein FPA-like isoform X1 [Actinidia eriantha]|uniref:flowering time control protein FPA-like isoform X1 n=1 Tax=Actinidia eriantha TaxID=165200 RepID=UPI002585DABB|nr:flowering time control protein FPA-like isoform X1 [Actinidia eriantha]XP_057460518.1 flowering time control protein FPA-like isoform X1 [Actinidia eriantha]